MEQEVNSFFLAAHELKTPLTTLRQLALSLDSQNSPANSHIQSEMINVSERALKQVSDLTKIARLEDGLFEMEPVSVRAVCDEVARELNYLFRSSNHGFKLKYQNKNKLVSANAELLKSVIYNFLSSAVHYSDSNTKSELKVKDEKGKVRILIRDFGPALPFDIWREIKTGQISQPTPIAMRPGSSSLSLYIASKFSRYMNANVGAIRHRDGTTFFVDLIVSNQASLF